MKKARLDRVYRFLYGIVFVFFCLFHPVKAIGREHIPEGAAVVAANHSAYADPLIAIFAMGRKNPLRIMAKEELFHIPVLGWILQKLGMFGVNRGQNDMAAVKQAIKFLKEGSKLMLFPEGTRVSSEDSVAAKTGAIMFALRTGAPLLPVYIPQKKNWFRPTRVVIGEAYLPQTNGKPSAEVYQELADDLLRRIYALGEQAR